MSKSKKHNQVFKILSITIPLRKSCSIFLSREPSLSEQPLKLLLTWHSVVEALQVHLYSLAFLSFCFSPFIPLCCKSFLILSEYAHFSVSLTMFPVNVGPGSFREKVLGLYVTPQPLFQQPRLMEPSRPWMQASPENNAQVPSAGSELAFCPLPVLAGLGLWVL